MPRCYFALTVSTRAFKVVVLPRVASAWLIVACSPLCSRTMLSSFRLFTPSSARYELIQQFPFLLFFFCRWESPFLFWNKCYTKQIMAFISDGGVTCSFCINKDRLSAYLRFFSFPWALERKRKVTELIKELTSPSVCVCVIQLTYVPVSWYFISRPDYLVSRFTWGWKNWSIITGDKKLLLLQLLKARSASVQLCLTYCNSAIVKVNWPDLSYSLLFVYM